MRGRVAFKREIVIFILQITKLGLAKFYCYNDIKKE